MTDTTAPASTFTYLDGETVETVTTTDLREGDLVLNYGMRLRLGERHQHNYYADAVWFTGTCENLDEILADPHHITRGLLRADGTWTVQGNHLAHWTRVVES